MGINAIEQEELDHLFSHLKEIVIELSSLMTRMNILKNERDGFFIRMNELKPESRIYITKRIFDNPELLEIMNNLKPITSENNSKDPEHVEQEI